jgi:hypothetical protein
MNVETANISNSQSKSQEWRINKLTLRAAGVRCDLTPLITDSLPIAHAWLAHGHRSDAGHDLALGQMPVTHDALVARPGIEIRISPQEVSDLRGDPCPKSGL